MGLQGGRYGILQHGWGDDVRFGHVPVVVIVWVEFLIVVTPPHDWFKVL
jgi:hypothetical protein